MHFFPKVLAVLLAVLLLPQIAVGSDSETSATSSAYQKQNYFDYHNIKVDDIQDLDLLGSYLSLRKVDPGSLSCVVEIRKPNDYQVHIWYSLISTDQRYNFRLVRRKIHDVQPNWTEFIRQRRGVNNIIPCAIESDQNGKNIGLWYIEYSERGSQSSLN